MTDDRLKPGNCHKCGLPMSDNPHPEAGRPAHYLDVGCPRECIPCLVHSRHQWAGRAMKAENEVRDLLAARATADHRDSADAQRYRWLRAQHWNESNIAVVIDPRISVTLGYDCPSEERLDELIDSSIAAGVRAAMKAAVDKHFRSQQDAIESPRSGTLLDGE